jgi:hypothetical protein
VRRKSLRPFAQNVTVRRIAVCVGAGSSDELNHLAQRSGIGPLPRSHLVKILLPGGWWLGLRKPDLFQEQRQFSSTPQVAHIPFPGHDLMIGPCARLVATTFAALLATHSPCGSAQEAPFGFHWVDHSLPKSSEMLQEKNITALLYRRDTIPEHIRDAEEIILKVCDQESLQQVIWVSRLSTGQADSGCCRIFDFSRPSRIRRIMMLTLGSANIL